MKVFRSSSSHFCTRLGPILIPWILMQRQPRRISSRVSGLTPTTPPLSVAGPGTSWKYVNCNSVKKVQWSCLGYRLGFALRPLKFELYFTAQQYSELRKRNEWRTVEKAHQQTGELGQSSPSRQTSNLILIRWVGRRVNTKLFQT